MGSKKLRALTARQKLALKWVAAGVVIVKRVSAYMPKHNVVYYDGHVMGKYVTPQLYSLQGRDLITFKISRGKWVAALTQKGRRELASHDLTRPTCVVYNTHVTRTTP